MDEQYLEAHEPYRERSAGPHADYEARTMHRLRGLVMAQACETEAVLGSILTKLNPSAKVERPAGALLKDIRMLLDADGWTEWTDALNLIHRAIERRNHTVHNPVHIGSTWMDYATGDGGEWVTVISLMGREQYDESDLRNDLALQQEATVAAVRLLYALRAAGPEDEACG